MSHEKNIEITNSDDNTDTGNDVINLVVNDLNKKSGFTPKFLLSTKYFKRWKTFTKKYKTNRTSGNHYIEDLNRTLL